MRTRLLVVLLVFSVTAVAAFALPLLMVTARERTQQLSISRTADLDRFAGLTQQDDEEQLVSEVTRFTSLYGEPVIVVNAQRQPIVATGGLGVNNPDIAPVIDSALRNQPAPGLDDVLPWSTSDVLLARPIGIGSRVIGAVVMRASVRAAASDVAGGWAVILAGAFAALVGCVLLTLVLARWVLRPLAELSRGLGAVAAGQLAHLRGRDGPRELRELASSFNRMSDAVSSAAEQQRRLISDASHQLRNPLAALRLRVDSLAPRVVPDGQASYHSAVAEVERLESLLDGLLAMAHAEHTATRLAASPDPDTCLAGAVVLDRIDFWSVAAADADVSLRYGDIDASLEVRCPEHDLSQVLDVVLDNAIKYGGCEVTVSCTTAAITVVDNGPGLSATELALATTRFWRSPRAGHPRGSGLGLPIAERLITARGGRFSLQAGEHSGLAVIIELPS
ncbi:sensor histidine kinase [Kutzneria sp. NPDC052558]|uniref:sensor histidine kinase n=1 Tax=Kutzneria sp. NPDC052558 TaxID=3364121 RepID=UPI0037C713E3